MPLDYPVFAPTGTKTFDRCPLLYQLQREGHTSKIATKPILARECGAAFALASAAIHATLAAGEPPAPAEAARIGLESLTTGLQTLIAAGMYVDPAEEQSCRVDLAGAIAKYAVECPLRPPWKITDIEQKLDDYGGCRIDVGGVDPMGDPTIVDIKFKRNLDARYLSSTVDEYRHDWQFLHYAWAYGQSKGLTHIPRTHLLLVIAKPRFSATLYTFPIHSETMAMWLTSAKQKWARMKDVRDGKLIPEMSANHKDQYGLCSMYDACFTYHLDPGLMATKYITIVRSK